MCSFFSRALFLSQSLSPSVTLSSNSVPSPIPPPQSPFHLPLPSPKNTPPPHSAPRTTSPPTRTMLFSSAAFSYWKPFSSVWNSIKRAEKAETGTSGETTVATTGMLSASNPYLFYCNGLHCKRSLNSYLTAPRLPLNSLPDTPFQFPSGVSPCSGMGPSGPVLVRCGRGFRSSGRLQRQQPREEGGYSETETDNG